MLLVLFLASSHNVTAADQLKQSVVEYVASRDDLTSAERKEWDAAVRRAFGGSALKTGLEDEGVTAAKSVVAFGMFHRLAPAAVAKAAYDAKNDVYSKVPPPVAIKYQTLVLLGRPPKESSRLLAFEFPKYYDEELAPDMVQYWRATLAAGTAIDAPRMERQLGEVIKKMTPRLRNVALDGAKLQALVKGGHVKPELAEEALDETRDELNDALGGLGNIAPLDVDFYGIHVRLSKDAGMAAEKRPVAPPLPKPVPPPPPPPPPTPEPSLKPPKKTTSTKPPPVKPTIVEPPPPAEDGECHTYPGWENVFASSVSKWIGTRYLFGGSDKNGIDCSAFSREVYRDTVRFELPRVSMDQYRLGIPIDQSELQKGDLVFFDTLEKGRITHVGVFDGEGILVHATSSRGVTREKLTNAWLQRAFRGCRRLLRAPS